MDLYRVYNFPAPYPELKSTIYICTRRTISSYFCFWYLCSYTCCNAVCVCFVTQSFLCVLNIALYLVGKTEWCVCDLFIKVHKLFNKHCLVDSFFRHVNLNINWVHTHSQLVHWLLNVFRSIAWKRPI